MTNSKHSDQTDLIDPLNTLPKEQLQWRLIRSYYKPLFLTFSYLSLKLLIATIIIMVFSNSEHGMANSNLELLLSAAAKCISTVVVIALSCLTSLSIGLIFAGKIIHISQNIKGRIWLAIFFSTIWNIQFLFFLLITMEGLSITTGNYNQLFPSLGIYLGFLTLWTTPFFYLGFTDLNHRNQDRLKFTYLIPVIIILSCTALMFYSISLNEDFLILFIIQLFCTPLIFMILVLCITKVRLKLQRPNNVKTLCNLEN